MEGNLTRVRDGSAGVETGAVRRVEALFDAQIAEGLHAGAQLVVLHRGETIVDRVGGLADVKSGRPVTPQTPFLTFSVTKPLAAICIHQLVEAGRIELDAPVADYWPAWGCGGKEAATVRHVLLHQAGVPVRGMNQQVAHWPSWSRVTRNVAALEAEWEPGTRTAYHLVNFGFILGEIVRRVTGWPIELYLQKEFLNPLGMAHTALGLPRTWRDESATLYCHHPENRTATHLFNLPAIRGAVMPAATLHSTARDLARFYQMLLNGGEAGGRRYLMPETIERATALRYEGWDESIMLNVRWGLGFQLGGSDPAKGIAPEGSIMGWGSTARTFGHFGHGTNMSWADPEAGLVAIFLCNGLQGVEEQRRRWRALADGIWDIVA